MKKTLYLVLKNSEKAYKTLHALKSKGYNATVISTESLRHAVDYQVEDHHFFNLRHLENQEMLESMLILFVIDEEKVDELKNTIREFTENFKAIKGFMYSRSIEDYEGSI